jgi:hypothetical protein
MSDEETTDDGKQTVGKTTTFPVNETRTLADVNPMNTIQIEEAEKK